MKGKDEEAPPALVAHIAYSMELAKVQAVALAKTLNELADTMVQCGATEEDEEPLRKISCGLHELVGMIDAARHVNEGGVK